MRFRRYLLVHSLGDAVRLSLGFMLASIVASAVVSEFVASMVGQPTDWKHYLFTFGMPILMTPLVALPLIGMNLHLNTMRLELEQVARTDLLTGLPNRRAFFERAEHFFATRPPHPPQAVMMIDIDHFKRVNDTFGHDAGDAVLRQVGATIAATLRAARAAEAFVGRIGGEEFAALVGGLDAPAVAQLADRICAAVRHSVTEHRGRSLTVTVSVGVAMRADAESVDTALGAADRAVYQAKRAGRDRICVRHGAGGAPLTDIQAGTLAA